MRRAAVAVLAASLAASPSLAQAPKPRPDAKPAPAPVAPEPPAPAYDAQMLRLAEVLGALAYLRELCGFPDGADYRAKLAALMDAEAASGPRRERIAGAFNRGFRGYELFHRACTPVSREAMRRALDEGGRLAREIGGRFGAS